MKTDKILEEKLRGIYDDDDFVKCMFTMTNEPWKREKMLGFIEMAHNLGDEVTYEDMVKLGMLLYEKENK